MFHVCTFGSWYIQLGQRHEIIILCSRHVCQVRTGRWTGQHGQDLEGTPEHWDRLRVDFGKV